MAHANKHTDYHGNSIDHGNAYTDTHSNIAHLDVPHGDGGGVHTNVHHDKYSDHDDTK